MTTDYDVDVHGDAALRVCAFHQSDFDQLLIRSDPTGGSEDVSKSLCSFFDTSPTAELGQLGSLPLELMTMVLLQLDLLSFFRFRHVNRRARTVATTLRQYQLLASSALQAVMALLRVRLDSTYTIKAIYQRLVTPDCGSCAKFGAYLYLPTLTRCCRHCIEYSTLFWPVRLKTVAIRTGLHIDDVNSVLEASALHAIPQKFSSTGYRLHHPIMLKLVDWMQACATLYLEGLIDIPLSPKDRLIEDTDLDFDQLRLKASTSFPWYDLDRHEADDGVNCKGCKIRFHALSVVDALTGRHPNSPNISYSRKGYLAHFKTCAEAQDMWKESKLQEFTWARGCARLRPRARQ